MRACAPCEATLDVLRDADLILGHADNLATQFHLALVDCIALCSVRHGSERISRRWIWRLSRECSERPSRRGIDKVPLTRVLDNAFIISEFIKSMVEVPLTRV